MGITAQFRPTQHTYQSTYEPFPFKDLAPLAMKMQQENMAGMDKLSATNQMIAGMTVATADQKIGEQKMQELQEKVSNVANKNKSFRSPEFHMNLNKVISGVKGDKFWKDTAHNAKMEQAWNNAINEATTPSDKLDMQLEFNEYFKKGSEGGNRLAAPTVPERIDYTKNLESMGVGFITEGNKAFTDVDGNIIVSESWEGKLPKEVALRYGYNYNDSTGAMTFAGIPPSFLLSKAGQSMKRDARYNAYISEGESTPEQELQKLYERSTRPLVYKYSGLQYSTNVQGMPGGGGKTPPGSLSFKGGVVTMPDRPETMEQITALDEESNMQLNALEQELASIDANTNPNKARYVQQQINDVNKDREERQSMIKAAHNDVDYQNQSDIAVVDVFAVNPEFGKKYYDTYTNRETTRNNDMFGESVEDWNGDGMITIDDARETLDMAGYAKDMESQISKLTAVGVATSMPEGFDKEKYDQGQSIIEQLKDDGDWKAAKKAIKRTEELDADVDRSLKTKAGTITYSSSAFAKVSEDAKAQLEADYDGGEQWRVEDSEGKVLEEGKKPGKLIFDKFTHGDIPGLGYVFIAHDKETDKSYKVSSVSIEGAGEMLGQALMDKNEKGSATWTDGFRMKYPGYASDVDRVIKEGGERTIYDRNTQEPVATVEKTGDKPPHYIVKYTGDDDTEQILGGDIEVTTRNKVLELLDAIVAPKENTQE